MASMKSNQLKIILILSFFIKGLLLYAQDNGKIGINTISPKATVDIKIAGNNALETASSNEGLLIPNVSRVRAANMALNTPIPTESTLIYINNLTGSATGATVNIDEKGFYFWKNNSWYKVRKSVTAWKLEGNNIDDDTNFLGTLNNEDLVFKRNNAVIGRLGNNSTTLGLNGLPTTSTGTNNHGFGHNVLSANTTGDYNIGIGNNTLNANTTGSNNIGINTLPLNTTGSDNIALGFRSMSRNITGNKNITLGSNTLRDNISGSGNIAMGNNILYKSNTGSNNIGVGFSIFPELANPIYGHNGNYNIAFGYRAIWRFVGGNNNIAMGNLALAGGNAGVLNDNIAIGYNSLYNTQTNANSNIALGGYALQDVTTGSNNIGIGEGSRNLTETGSNNISIASGYYSRNDKSNILLLGRAIMGKNINNGNHNNDFIGINPFLSEPNSTLSLNGTLSANITSTSGSLDKEFTIFITADLTLPSPVGITGRVYNLINDSNTNNYTLFGIFRIAGQNVTNKSLAVGKGITIQSNGTAWVLIAQF